VLEVRNNLTHNMGMNAMLFMTQQMSKIERQAEAAEQAQLRFPECQARLAERPPFYRCSSGARYDNPGQRPPSPGPQDPEPNTPTHYPFDS